MKTCFYCGRELAAGERCPCRGGATGQGTASPTSGSSAGSGDGSARKSSASGPSSEAGSSSSAYSHDASEKNSSASATGATYEKPKKEKKTKQVWNQEKRRENRFTFNAFITQVRTMFPSFSKLMHPVMTYIWHPVTTIQNRSQVVPIAKVIIVNTLFATLTSLMVIFTSFTDSPFLGMLISLIFGKTDLFTAHPVKAFFILSSLLLICVLLLALCFTWTSRIVNRKMTFLRSLDTVSISSIYLCFADVLIFLSVLLGTRGAFTLIFVAFVIMGLCHFVSIKQDLALSDNASFNMLVVSYLLFYVLAQIAANILIRVATYFRF